MNPNQTSTGTERDSISVQLNVLMEIPKKYQKMQLFHNHQPERGSDWYNVMADVLQNFKLMEWEIGQLQYYEATQFKSIRLPRCYRVFHRCALKWCVEEDGVRINREFVDILSDLETLMAKATRSDFEFDNMDTLSQRIAQACLRVMTSDSSPTNFIISKDFLEDYEFQIWCADVDCWDPIKEKITSQLGRVRSVTNLVMDNIDMLKNRTKRHAFLTYVESLLDKAACYVFLASFESYYTMYLSGPSNKLESLIGVGIQNVSALYLDTCPVEIWNNGILKAYVDCIHQKLMELRNDEGIDLTSPVKDQLEMLRHKLGSLVDFLIDCPPTKLYVEEGRPNLLDFMVDVYTVARNIESLTHSSFITDENQDINLAVAAAVAKVSPGLEKLLASVSEDWVLNLTSYVAVPLSDKLLIQFVECVQRFMSGILKDGNINLTSTVKDQLDILHREMGILVNVHIHYPPQVYTEEGSNLVNVRVGVQTVTNNIASFLYSSFITQNDENNIVAAAAKMSLSITSLLDSIRGALILQLKSCINHPLTDELLSRFVECIQRFMYATLNDKYVVLTGPLKDQIEILHHEMEFLADTHINCSARFHAQQGRNLVDVRVEVQTAARNIASFIFQTKEKSYTTKVSLGFLNLLDSIIKVWVLLLTRYAAIPSDYEHLMESMKRVEQIMSGNIKDENIAFPVIARHHFQIMDDYKYKPNSRVEKEKLLNIRKQVLVHIRTIHSSFDNVTTDVPETGLSSVLSILVEKLADLKAQDMVIYFLVVVCRLRKIIQRTDELGVLNFLNANMEELMSGGSDLIREWKDEFLTIHKALILFENFLQTMTNNDTHDSQYIRECVVNVAYEAEYLIYSFYDGACPTWCRASWISDFVQHVELTKTSLLDIIEKKENESELTADSAKDQNHISSQSLIPTIDLVVGFEGEMEQIKQVLIARYVKQLNVVSIIGMPGLGKTTLAKKVYEDRQIANHFEVRAWCCVSSDYNKKEMLLAILGCIIELTDLIRKMSEMDLSTLLHKQLTGRRYLVVMDDVWGIDAFECLKPYLPDNGNGGRIMLTTRNKAIGVKAKLHSDPLELRTLTDEESWNLLSQKVYHKHECPMEFCDVGKRIAQKCRGLPLAIVVVAGLLAKSDKKREFWEKVAENLSSYMALDSQAQGMAVLGLSYKLLPSHLKPLFLYIGAFPEDREIPVDKLIWLWISEGFVRDTKLRSLEVQAELYLIDLIDRNFLMVAATRSDGRVKTCIVHDLLRDMCLLKGKQEHLMQQINVSDDLPDPIFYQKRLSIHLQGKGDGPTCLLFDEDPRRRPFITYEDLSALSLTPPLYSFLFFNKSKSHPFWSHAVESVFRELRLSRVLHIENMATHANECDIMMLVHLRYISIRVSWTSIPSSISKLWNLETLIIKGLRGEILVPEAIWEMVKLRHLHVNDRAKFSDPTEKYSTLENLETLSTPVVRYGGEEMIMKRLPNVRKLRCIFLESRNPYRDCNAFPQFGSSYQLESLKIIYAGIARCSGPFLVPLRLKKLSLSKFRLKWEEISMFQSLPELEVLNLRTGAVDGELWDMDEENEERFLKLKFLKLESLNVKQWNACAENFPCLEKLVLKKCKQLKEIPNDLGSINSLQKIEVWWCSSSAAISAKTIEKEQEELSNELLKVHIYPPVMDSESSA